MRVFPPRMHRKATEIRHGETEENEDKEQSEKKNQNRDIGLQTAQFDFEVFNLNAQRLAGFIGVLQKMDFS